MSKIKCVIIDDEIDCLQFLQWQLSEYVDGVEIVGTFSSPIDGLAGLVKLRPDLVLMDIDMPDMTAFDILREIEKVEFGVIFITAFHETAVQAFKAFGINYLLKPTDPQELKNAIEKFRKQNKQGWEEQLRLVMLRLDEISKTAR